MRNLNSHCYLGTLKKQKQKEKVKNGKETIRECAQVYCGCCNKRPQTSCLNTTKVYSLTVLKARNPKSVSLNLNKGISRGIFCLEALGENPHASFSSWWLLAWAVAAGLGGNCITLLFKTSIFKALSLHDLSCGCVVKFLSACLSLALLKTLVIACRAHRENPGNTLHLRTIKFITSAKIHPSS